MTTRPPEHPSAAWQDQQEVGNRFWLRFAVSVTRWMPRWVGYGLLYPTALYFVATMPAARAASRDWLTRTLPHRPRLRDVFRHFHRFAVVVMDRAYFLQGRIDHFAVTVDGEDKVRALADTGGGGFLTGAHVGSFEAARALGRARGESVRFAMVMYEDNARRIQAALTALNPALAGDVISLGLPDSMLRVMHALDAGKMVGLLADRLPAKAVERSEVRIRTFLGQPAPFPVGPFRLAALMRRPVMLMLGLYMGGNRYHIVFEPIADFTRNEGDRNQAIDAALDRYVTRLEHHARAHPNNWFNFFDFWDQSATGPAASATPEVPAPATVPAPASAGTGRTAMLVALITIGALCLTVPGPTAQAQTATRTASPAKVPAAISAISLESILARISAQATQEAAFTEALHTALLDAPVTSAGVLRFDAPGRLEKRTVKPRAESLVLDGDLLILEREGRKRTLPASQMPGVAALVGALRDVLAGRPAAIRRLFRVEVQGTEHAWQIDLLPADIDAASLVSRITLTGGAAIDRIETRLADGDRSDLRILPR